MLIELHVENFAIIEHLDLEFSAGLITFTGETGAGKSIIIDAVETLLGGRADAGLVRSGAERAEVEGVFSIPLAAQSAVQAILEREDLLEEPASLRLGREIRLNGRSVARVNGRSVNAGLLRELGEFLVDVHGQSEHLSLLRVPHHLALLDEYASAKESHQNGLGKLLADYRQLYEQLLETRRQLDILRGAERDAARRSEMLNFQIKEIESAHLHAGEEENLKEERNRLANAESLASSAQEAITALDESAGEAQTVTDLFGQVVRAISNLARLDPSQAAIYDQVETLADGLSDLTSSLRSYLEGIEFNPRRLDVVEERLAFIHGLKRKYGDDIPAILKFGEQARQQLEEVTHAGERLQELEEQAGRLLAKLGEKGQAISQQRRTAASELGKAVERELGDLHMSGARFSMDFQQRSDVEGVILSDGRRVAFDIHGLEKVEFLIAPNPGEGFKPLAKIASGGETSRLMLALKNVLARADHIPTLIFDEIDQGIGGRVGTIVGQKLRSLARQHQVLCITHLPQLAAFGEQHFQVLKRVHDGRTSTEVCRLQGEDRLKELAQMLGEVSDGTLRSAQELLQAADRRSSAGS